MEWNFLTDDLLFDLDPEEEQPTLEEPEFALTEMLLDEQDYFDADLAYTRRND